MALTREPSAPMRTWRDSIGEAPDGIGTVHMGEIEIVELEPCGPWGPPWLRSSSNLFLRYPLEISITIYLTSDVDVSHQIFTLLFLISCPFCFLVSAYFYEYKYEN